MLETVLGGEPTPPYARTDDVFVALSFAAASTITLSRGESGASDPDVSSL